MKTGKRKEIKHIFGKKCSICGVTKNLTIHHRHKQHWSSYNFRQHKCITHTDKLKLVYDVLCWDCHKKLHLLENHFYNYRSTMRRIKNQEVDKLGKKIAKYVKVNPEYAFEKATEKVVSKIAPITLSQSFKNYFLNENKNLNVFYNIFENNGGLSSGV